MQKHIAKFVLGKAFLDLEFRVSRVSREYTYQKTAKILKDKWKKQAPKLEF